MREYTSPEMRQLFALKALTFSPPPERHLPYARSRRDVLK
jgi:hypothetical protein